MFFNSNFYQFVQELKSKTNIEWGFVVSDKDFWDPIDMNLYGIESLPIALDPDISYFITPIPIKSDIIKFDPIESFKMGYYFESVLIDNKGIPVEAFQAGVGHKKDCLVSYIKQNISSKESKINLNPIVINPKNTFDIDNESVSNLIINI
jgi:hypothetical protein